MKKKAVFLLIRPYQTPQQAVVSTKQNSKFHCLLPAEQQQKQKWAPAALISCIQTESRMDNSEWLYTKLLNRKMSHRVNFQVHDAPVMHFHQVSKPSIENVGTVSLSVVSSSFPLGNGLLYITRYTSKSCFFFSQICRRRAFVVIIGRCRE